MQVGFWTTLTRETSVVSVLIFSVGMCLTSAVNAQTDSVPDSSSKKKVEPVFRVSKLVDSKQDRRTEEEKSQQGNDGFSNQAVDSKPARVASTNVEPNRTPAITKAVLESPPATRVIPPSTGSLPGVKVPVSPAKAVVTRTPHPLDQAVNFAHDALDDMRAEVYDYTALMAKREQINGVVSAPSYMSIKVRCPRVLPNGTQQPFSIYMKFLRPKQFAGREVIWVDKQNEGKLVVHEAGGLIGMKTFFLDPTGLLAMRGQRYPIYEAGLENLIIKLIEKAERDRDAGPCTVNYRDGADINKRPCSLIELIHNDRRQPYEFHKAHVFIDKELKVPVRFAAYDWPVNGQKPALLEEYTYYNIKVNVGLTDMDFNKNNPAYRYPKR